MNLISLEGDTADKSRPNVSIKENERDKSRNTFKKVVHRQLKSYEITDLLALSSD